MRRGEIWLPKAPKDISAQRQRKRHPALLLSWDAHLSRDRVIVAPVTGEIRGLDSEVFLDHRDGMQQGCVVNLDIIYTIFKKDLERTVTTLSDQRMREVDQALHYALGIELPCSILPRIPRPQLP